jgi:hypothetical protein
MDRLESTPVTRMRLPARKPIFLSFDFFPLESAYFKEFARFRDMKIPGTDPTGMSL